MLLELLFLPHIVPRDKEESLVPFEPKKTTTNAPILHDISSIYSGRLRAGTCATSVKSASSKSTMGSMLDNVILMNKDECLQHFRDVHLSFLSALIRYQSDHSSHCFPNAPEGEEIKNYTYCDRTIIARKGNKIIAAVYAFHEDEGNYVVISDDDDDESREGDKGDKAMWIINAETKEQIESLKILG